MRGFGRVPRFGRGPDSLGDSARLGCKLGGKSGAQKLNSLLCGRVRVWLGQYFHRYPIVVADVSEDPKNLVELNVPPARREPIRIGYMDITYEVAGLH